MLSDVLGYVCVAAIVGYAGTAAFVVTSRIGYEARHRRLAGLDAAEGSGSAGWSTLSTSDAMACLANAEDPLAQRALAALIVDRLGIERVRAAAVARQGRRRAWRRIAALRVLGVTRPDGWVRCMDEAFATGTPEVAAAAAAVLGQLDDPQAGAVLMRALESGRYSRARLATALDVVPVPVDHLLQPLLFSTDPDVRYWATLLMRRYPKSVGLDAALVALASDNSAYVRKAALDTLSVLGDAAAAAARAALDDEVPFVRAQAARTLGSIGAHEAADDVLALLADEQWIVRAAAKQALEAMGPAVASAVARYLSHPDRFACDGAAEVLQNLRAA